MRLLDPLFTTDRMREIFSDANRLQRMLDFEVALARSLVRTGVAPAPSAPAIQAQCHAKFYSHEALAKSAALAGNLAIPLVKELTALVAKSDPAAAGFVHLGATSQDAIERHRERLAETRRRVEVLQFGGAVGTLAALGKDGLRVAETLAGELKLALPDLPWHAQRDRVTEVAATFGLLVGTLGKIARDISLMSQTEIGELDEPTAPGRGGSSTLPHKRNPIGCGVILAAAIRVPPLVSTMLTAMVQEHERGLGGWQAEWETLPEICMLTSGALSHLSQILAGLQINEAAMAENLHAAHGLMMAESVAMVLAKKIGRMPAHELLERLSHQAINTGQAFRDVLLADAEISKHFSAADIDRLLDPRQYTGAARDLIERVLVSSKKNSA